MKLNSQQQRELVFLLLLILGAAFVGALFDATLLFVLAMVVGYMFYQLRNLFLLHNWILNRGLRLPDASGYWGEIFNEIHLMEKGRRKNRERLNRVLSRFQNAAQALPDGAIILTRHNEIDWLNQAACRMFGIRQDTDIGRKINNLIRHPVFSAYLEKKDYSRNIEIPRPMNPDHKLEIQVVPFGSNQKLVLCRDITHVTQLQEMRSRFISNVSHELRSPLTVIKGYMEIMSEDDEQHPVTDYQKRVYTNMCDQVDRMDRLVDDLLTLTRLETESIKPNEEINVPSLLSAIRDNAEIFGKDKNQDISLETEPDLWLLGNNDELTSLFTNLVNNAVRYTPEQGRIQIRWHKQGEQAIFSVTDTGPGIEREHIAHLTERFYRVDSDRSRETGGTGLGLSIVKHVLERHDGFLDVDSTPGKGSTFTCRFPAQRLVVRK